MKTKLHLTLWSLIFSLCFNFSPLNAQSEVQSAIIQETALNTEVSFTLINASTNQPINGFDPIPEGAEINLYTFPKFLSIRANVPSNYESVRFDFDGVADFRVENLPPYSLFGDIAGDYESGMFSTGTHTLSATPFSQDNASGTSGMTASLDFSVVKRSVSFTLVDADTDQDLFTIDSEMVIDINTIKDKNLNIRTNHDRAIDGLSVHFSINSLDGVTNRIWTEHVFPYSIFGDVNGDFNGVQLPKGRYHILAVFDYGDNPGFEVEPSIELNFEIRGISISRFITTTQAAMDLGETRTLVNDGIYQNNKFPFDGETIIAARTTGDVGSVYIEITGPITYSRIENFMPYSLFGDSNGVFGSREFQEGAYKLTATPYTEPNGQGFAGESLTISFHVAQKGFILKSLKLVDAENSNLINDLLSGDANFVNIEDATNATVLVEYDCINGLCPESVAISLDGPITTFRIENFEPFALFGDINGELIGKAFPEGTHSIGFTPYTGNNGTGLNGANNFTIPIRIVNQSNLSLKTKNTVLFPNPARTTTYVQSEEGATGIKTVIYDLSGNKVKEISNRDSSLQAIDVSELRPGIYIVQMQKGKERITKKLVVQ